MKRNLSFCAACLAACLLCACNAQAGASSAEKDAIDSSVQSASLSDGASSSAETASSSEVSSVSSTSESAAESSSVAPDQVDLTIPYTTSGGNSVQLTLTIPSTWTYDGYSTLSDSETGMKCMEIAAVYEIEDPANPITEAMRAPFKNTGEEMVGFSDFVQGVSNANGRQMEYYRTSSVPDGADFTWYSFFTLSYDEKYVYQLHFFTSDENTIITSFFDVIASAHAE